jgi:hypothetical protein
MANSDDEVQAFNRWCAKMSKRTTRHLLRAMEARAATMARNAIRRRRGRRGLQGQRQPPANPITELRKELMPMIKELAELAGGGDIASARKPRPPGRRRHS